MTSVSNAALVSLGLAPRTVTAYGRMLARLERFAGAGVDELDADSVFEFARTLPPSRWSRAQLRSALRAGLEALGVFDQSLLRAVRVPPKPRQVCRALAEEPAALLAERARDCELPGALAILLGLYAALRRVEIARLGWGDVDLAGGWLAVHGKGDRFARVPLHPVLLAELRRRRRFRVGPMFPGRFGGHCTPTTIGNWIREASEELGVPCTPHVLRHTCLATLNDLTHDLRAVQEIARHARPETTAGYTRVRDRRMVATIYRLDYAAIAAAAAVEAS